MNTAITYDDLPPAEREVADLYAWGMIKKQIAARRGKSKHTVENQIRRLFEKTDTKTAAEFSAWYFCTRFKISLDFSPIHRAIISICLLVLLSIGSITNNSSMYCRALRTARTTRTAGLKGRSRQKDNEYFDF